MAAISAPPAAPLMCSFSRLAFCTVLLLLSRCRRKGRPSCQQDFYYPLPPRYSPFPPAPQHARYFLTCALFLAISSNFSSFRPV